MTVEEIKRAGGSNAVTHTPMPPERKSVTHRFAVGGQKGYVTVGLYDDGSPGEIFLVVKNVGTTARGLAHTAAVLTSVCLQHGVPLEKIVEKFKSVVFEPRGFTGNPAIPVASSIIDYVGRWLELKFLVEREPKP